MMNMKRIYESVALGMVAVNELKDLITDERNQEKKEVLECVRFSYYYLILNLTEQFGVNYENLATALVENGYDYRQACDQIDRYKDWECHVIKINERGDNT